MERYEFAQGDNVHNTLLALDNNVWTCKLAYPRFKFFGATTTELLRCVNDECAEVL